jgi:hypothetical protein
MEPIGSPETSCLNHLTPRSNPEEGRIQTKNNTQSEKIPLPYTRRERRFEMETSRTIKNNSAAYCEIYAAGRCILLYQLTNKWGRRAEEI